MIVPLLDLKAQYASIKEQILCAVAEVLESQICIGGPRVEALETAIAARSGCRYGIGVSSGTDALLCSLMALGIGAGDEVITTSFTFFATAGCIARLGATPVFVDIDPRTYNIDPNLITPAITTRTKAIIPVHLFGQMADMDAIVDIASKHGLPIVEDAAQAISATYKGRSAGSIGDLGCLSFFPSKNLGGAGDGGMIVTNDEKLYERILLLRNHGAKPKYYHRYVGGNFRLDSIQAAILLVKLNYLDSWTDARRRNAEYYNLSLKDCKVVTPYIRPDCNSVFNQYVIRLENRSRLQQTLAAAGISTEIYYPVPLHQQDCFASVVSTHAILPQAETAACQVLALPIYPELSAEMLRNVSDTVVNSCSMAQVAVA
jgi:dTDP-4-amino-4,6-dideoxygalactose transaminase